jgi:GAF domain-containing protein
MVTKSRPDVVEALEEAAHAINGGRSLEETLDAIVHTALRSVPGFDHVGISITHKDGRVETKAATDDLVWKLDLLQYELGEGPCLDAIRSPAGVGRSVAVEYAGRDQRWPTYMPLAVEAGLRAQLGVQLYATDGTVGGLNMYSTTSDTVDPDAHLLAELFATHAAQAFGHARTEDQLNEALATRKVIGQAVGIVMGRYDIDEDGAFAFLVRASTTSNTKLRVIADEVVRLANERARDQHKAGTENDPVKDAVNRVSLQRTASDQWRT